MQKSTKSERIVSYIFISVVVLFFCFIALRTVTRQVFVKHMGMSNEIIDLILFDMDYLNEEDRSVADEDEDNVSGQATVDINWQERYPFDEATRIEDTKPVETVSALDLFRKRVSQIEYKVETYTTNDLPWYKQLTELAKGYEHAIQWNVVNYAEYNSITQVDGDYLATLVEEKDVTEAAESTIDFAKFCEEHGADFVFIQQPSKICVYEDAEISGATDYSNQNIDSFLSLLQAAGVDTYDHRTDIHKEGLNHHSLFYNTDHHWKAETGLWASQHVLSYLNSAYGYGFDERILDADRYSSVLYPDWFLGSQGKKVTLEVAKPEDISLIYPKYDTRIHYVIPSLGIDAYGGFDITYDMTSVSEIDYYNKNAYGAYDHSDQPLIQIENMLIDDGPRMLIVHRSYANCEIPFLAMAVKYIDAIDLRYFNGSLRSYVEATNPDIVIVTYEKPEDKVDWETHDDVFDFR